MCKTYKDKTRVLVLILLTMYKKSKDDFGAILWNKVSGKDE